MFNAPPVAEGKLTAADIAIEIMWSTEAATAVRACSAAEVFIQACSKLDAALARSATEARPVAVLEDVEGRSLVTWIRCDVAASALDSSIPVELHAPLVEYLQRAKHDVLDWFNDGSADKDIMALLDRLEDLAVRTGASVLPSYKEPSILELADAIRELERGRGNLLAGDSARLLTQFGSTELKLGGVVPLDSLFGIATVLVCRDVEMLLIVDQPDLGRSGVWQMRHGADKLKVRCEDADWLNRYHSRRIDIRPGDALHCCLRRELKYGHDNALVQEELIITQVLNSAMAKGGPIATRPAVRARGSLAGADLS